MQFGLPTAHDGQIASEKNLLSCWGIIGSLIPFNASVSAAEFQQAKPPSPALKLCVLLMLQKVNEWIQPSSIDGESKFPQWLIQSPELSSASELRFGGGVGLCLFSEWVVS